MTRGKTFNADALVDVERSRVVPITAAVPLEWLPDTRGVIKEVGEIVTRRLFRRLDVL